jgi:hypothetical protein
VIFRLGVTSKAQNAPFSGWTLGTLAIITQRVLFDKYVQVVIGKILRRSKWAPGQACVYVQEPETVVALPLVRSRGSGDDFKPRSFHLVRRFPPCPFHSNRTCSQFGIVVGNTAKVAEASWRCRVELHQREAMIQPIGEPIYISKTLSFVCANRRYYYHSSGSRCSTTIPCYRPSTPSTV